MTITFFFFSVWLRIGFRNYKYVKILGTTKLTRKTPYKEGCVLDLVLSPLYWLVLGINYITFTTQITFDVLCMLSKIWCANVKATYEKENVNLCLFPLYLSVTTLTSCYSGCLLKPSHLHTCIILYSLAFK